MVEKKKALFPLRQQERITIRVPLKTEEGARYEVVHVMRPPSAEDKKNYMRLLEFTEYDEENKPRVYRNAGAAGEAVYDSCVIEVQGYDVPEGTGDWKALLPLDHKLWVVNLLLKLSGSLDGKLSKN